MTIYYTARASFHKENTKDAITWNNYVKQSKLTHLQEVVSLDVSLNEPLVEPDFDNGDDWERFAVDGEYHTELYTTEEYVLHKMRPAAHFNMLAAVIRPGKECRDIALDGYEFMGYELLDKSYGNSALTNCGKADVIFLPRDLNSYGLVSQYTEAIRIQKRLLSEHTQDPHADTNVIAIWRHTTTGRATARFRKPRKAVMIAILLLALLFIYASSLFPLHFDNDKQALAGATLFLLIGGPAFLFFDLMLRNRKKKNKVLDTANIFYAAWLVLLADAIVRTLYDIRHVPMINAAVYTLYFIYLVVKVSKLRPQEEQ